MRQVPKPQYNDPNDEDQRDTMDAYNMRPDEVLDNDQFGYKYIAVVNGEFWSLFRGFTNWNDDFIRTSGDRVYDEEFARKMFPVLSNKTFWS